MYTINISPSSKGFELNGAAPRPRGEQYIVLRFGEKIAIREVVSNEMIASAKHFSEWNNGGYPDVLTALYAIEDIVYLGISSPITSPLDVNVISNTTDYSTATNQLDILNAIQSLKDGEFKILCDSLTDRKVGIFINSTDPINQTFIYKYMDDDSIFLGDINSLTNCEEVLQPSVNISDYSKIDGIKGDIDECSSFIFRWGEKASGSFIFTNKITNKATTINFDELTPSNKTDEYFIVLENHSFDATKAVDLYLNVQGCRIVTKKIKK